MRIGMTVLLGFVAVFSVQAAYGDGPEAAVDLQSQTTCPVMGGKINKNIFADHDGKRIYFCCAGCTEKFEGDPEAYIEKLEDAGVTLEKAVVPQTTCPVMGGKINKNIFADYDGKRVYFCCAGCPKKFEEDPEAFIKKLEAQGVTVEKLVVPQTTCPVMGGKINKAIFADHAGKRIYFCCAGCTKKFEADPEAYIEKLEDQGVTPESVLKPVDMQGATLEDAVAGEDEAAMAACTCCAKAGGDAAGHGH